MLIPLEQLVFLYPRETIRNEDRIQLERIAEGQQGFGFDMILSRN